MRPISLLILTALLVAGASTGAAHQQSSGQGPQDELEVARRRGALLFRIHCASCHGPEGRGDGPLADGLGVVPTDLTELTERAESGGSDFPAARLAALIDGREGPGVHGKRGMPVWGLGFQDSGRDTNQEQSVTGKIADLIEHLRTLQVAGAEEPPKPDGAD